VFKNMTDKSPAGNMALAQRRADTATINGCTQTIFSFGLTVLQFKFRFK